MKIEIPSYVKVRLHYESDYEKCFLCGALCLSDYNQYHIDSEKKHIDIVIYFDEMEGFKDFMDDLKAQVENHSDILIDYTI